MDAPTCTGCNTLELPAGRQETASWAAVAFIASYSSEATRRTYTTQLRLWMGCARTIIWTRWSISVVRTWSCTPVSLKPAGWPR